MNALELQQVSFIKNNLYMTNQQLAEQLSISFHRVRNLQRKYNCCRSANEVYELKSRIGKEQTGPANKNWKGGISKNNMHYKAIQLQRYPEHVRARQIVANALKAGKLIKNNCLVCGDTNTHAHHKCYDEPLNIIWLCPVCHRGIHQLKRAV